MIFVKHPFELRNHRNKEKTVYEATFQTKDYDASPHGLGFSSRPSDYCPPPPGLVVKADEKPYIYTMLQDVENGEVCDILSPPYRVIPRGETQNIQKIVTKSPFKYPDDPAPISGYKVKLLDANTDEVLEVQTTDEKGMVTFIRTEDQIKEICHREPKEGDYRKFLPETLYWGFIKNAGGYNQKADIYRLKMDMDQQEIGGIIYQGGIVLATRVGFSYQDTKVCNLELTPLTLNYGADFNKMDVVTRVGIDWQGDKKEFDFKNAGAKDFTFKNPEGEPVNTVDTTKPGDYTVSVTIYPFGKEKYSWCWDTQTTTVTVNPIDEFYVTYDLNGGTGQAPDPQVTQNHTHTVLSLTPEKDQATFLGWQKDDDDTILYKSGAVLTLTKSITLKAIYEDKDHPEPQPPKPDHEDSEPSEPSLWFGHDEPQPINLTPWLIQTKKQLPNPSDAPKVISKDIKALPKTGEKSGTQTQALAALFAVAGMFVIVMLRKK